MYLRLASFARRRVAESSCISPAAQAKSARVVGSVMLRCVAATMRVAHASSDRHRLWRLVKVLIASSDLKLETGTCARQR